MQLPSPLPSPSERGENEPQLRNSSTSCPTARGACLESCLTVTVYAQREQARPEAFVMDRTVPKTGSEEIELYMRTYYSLLRSTHTIQIETLVETHMAIESSLHVNARSPHPDASALTYSSL